MDKSVNSPAPVEKKGYYLRWLWLSLLVLILDYATKQTASAYLTYQLPTQVLPIFDLYLVHNEGAAFSFLSDAGGWQRWFFIAISIFVSIFLVVWLWRMAPQNQLLALAICLIIGGALGNLYDRIVYGYVIDFISLHWQQSRFPAFNIADSAISVGAFLMAIDMFIGEGQKQDERK